MRSRGFTDVKTAATVGLALVIPFILLELGFAQNSFSNFPLALFVILWLLTAAFTAVLMPLARTLLAGNESKVRPTTVVLSAVVLMMIASIWGAIVLDQMPCFLGVPNCD